MQHFSSVAVLLLSLTYTSEALTKIHKVYWNITNPIFRIDNTDHIVDVNNGNLPWEYDQLNLICPHNSLEKHIVYSVTREEFEGCRVTNPKPKIVAICNKPESFMYFTITFRSFSPTPGGLEFKPGQDYYFISTSTQRDLHRRVGGYCQSNKMKMVFRVHEAREQRIDNTVPAYSGFSEARPQPRAWGGLRPGSDYIYYYKPWASASRRQLRTGRLRLNTLTSGRRSGTKVLKALPFTASASSESVLASSALLVMITVARSVL